MRYRTVGLFIALAAVWGTAFVAIKAGLTVFPPVLFAALRYDIAGVLMLGYAASVTDLRPRGWRSWATIVVGATLLIAAYHALLFVGETDPAVTSAAAAVIVSLSPVLTTAWARLFLPGERLAVTGLVGLALGLAGVVVLADPEPGALLAGGVVAKFEVFGAAAAFALGSVLTRRLDADLPIETMEAWSMIGGAVLLHAVAVLRPSESLAAITWTVEGILALGYLAVVASALGFLVYFRLLAELGPIEINLVSYVAPVFAAVVGWLLLGETVSINTIVGFVLVVIGFALVKREAISAEWPRIYALLRGRE
ncbi:MAG: DMT family transporter [Halobacteriaceae archaeon]